MLKKIVTLIFILLLTNLYAVADETGFRVLKINGGVEKLSGLDEVIDQLSGDKIVYIGEIHNRHSHHEVQLEIIKGLYMDNPDLAIGMEMFQSDFQDVINNYLRGKISLNEFLKQTEYEKRWGFDYGLYKPILEFARDKGIPVVALSINSEIVRKISEKGIAELDSATLSRLPLSVDFTNTEYKKFIKEIFESHPKTKNSDLEKFYNIQVIWDESMAENIDRYMSAHKKKTMIVLAGNGHIIYRYGIPDRVYRRNGLKYSTILNDTEHKKGVSDFVIYSRENNFH